MWNPLIIFTTALTFILSLALGIYTLSINPREKINKLWFLSNLAVALWTFSYILLFLTTDDKTAAFLQNFLYTGAILIPIFLFHFVVLFTYQKGRFILLFGYLYSSILIILLYTTDLLLKGTFVNRDFFDEIRGPLFPFYLLYFFLFIILSVIFLIKKYLKADGIYKKQILYILIAILISAIGGSTNYITEIYDIYPYGQTFVFLYPIIITYALFLKKY
ncbi:hypothetical protein C4569_03040 [Candidatus Parcubacteria bacterium]|nr:MAG: hypothetical protein C4569_03040 [Candidatus Parcubacteria bacterium]